jgi:5-formyltetrahydrofolate cyclo-ligase
MVDGVTAEAKSDLRARFLAARRAIAPSEHDAEARLLAERLPELAAAGQSVCAYVPVGAEPGSVEMIDALTGAGVRVLLPVARHDPAGTPLPLQWGEYRPGHLVDARYGLREPPEPWLPAAEVSVAALVLVPALAVDRTGIRLGRGAGFYDRTLRLADPAARLMAVIRDDELVDRLPAEPHDVPMTHALTPMRGVTALGVTGESRE